MVVTVADVEGRLCICYTHFNMPRPLQPASIPPKHPSVTWNCHDMGLLSPLDPLRLTLMRIASPTSPLTQISATREVNGLPPSPLMTDQLESPSQHSPQLHPLLLPQIVTARCPSCLWPLMLVQALENRAIGSTNMSSRVNDPSSSHATPSSHSRSMTNMYVYYYL